MELPEPRKKDRIKQERIWEENCIDFSCQMMVMKQM